MTDSRLYAAVDLGGTKILVLIASPTGEVLASERIPTEAEGGPAAVIERMAHALRTAIEEAAVPFEQLDHPAAVAREEEVQ